VKHSKRPYDLTPSEERQKENEGMGQRREEGRKGRKKGKKKNIKRSVYYRTQFTSSETEKIKPFITTDRRLLCGTWHTFRETTSNFKPTSTEEYHLLGYNTM
jgi:hypothetical protein